MTPLGLDARLYRNDAVYATPNWIVVGNVKDLTLNLEEGETDVTTRSNNGYRATIGTLKHASVELEMIWDTADPDFEAFRLAFLNKTTIDVAVMDGDITASGSQGLRAHFSVLKFTRTEELEAAIMVQITLKPGRAPEAPDWLEIP